MSKLAINGGTPVRVNKFPAHNYIQEEEKSAVNRVLDSGILSRYLGCWDSDFYGGPEVRAFEEEWAKYFGVKHAIAVNSATSGLICAIGAVGISPGDEVLVSPYSMCVSATAPLWYGGIPVFVDIEEDYFCIDPNLVEEKITEKTKAILAVDLFGQPYNAEKINAIAQKYNLVVIEDCAQAPQAMYKNKFAGTLGDLGVYSLNYHKHIHTGEGGVVVTNNDELANRVQLIRNHAEAVVEEKKDKNRVNMIGQNYRLTEIQAAIGRAQLRKLKNLITERVQNCEYIGNQISQIPGIEVPMVREHATHSYYVQPLLFNEEVVGVSRDIFIRAVSAELSTTELRECEGPLIGCGYVKPLYLLPLFQDRQVFGNSGYPFNLASKFISYKKGLCPVAENLYEKKLFTHEFMRPPANKVDLYDVVKAFEKVYENKNELI
jgi:perosamine synthetase